MSITITKNLVKRLSVGAVAAAALVGVTVFATKATLTPDAAIGAPSSASASSSAAEESKPNFSNAKKFSRAVATDDYESATALAAPGSAAAKYVEHQEYLEKAQRADGSYAGKDDVSLDPDEDTETILVEYPDSSYTWSEFTYDGDGLVTGWTGKGGPIKDVLWSATDSDSVSGLAAKELSAYRSNAGDVWVVLELKASKTMDLSLWDAKYVADDAYTQKADSASTISKLKKGEKTLVYLSFSGADFGGKLSLDVHPSSDWQKTETLSFKIK